MSYNLDQLFKKALQDKSCEPPAHVWENIHAHLIRKDKKKVLWWRSMAAALALMAALAGTWLMEIRPGEKTPAGWTQQVPTLYGPVKTKTINRTTPSIPLAQMTPEATKPAPGLTQPETGTATIRPQDRFLPDAPENPESGLLSNTCPLPEIKTKGLRRTFIPLTSGEAYRNQKEYLLLLEEDTQEKRQRGKYNFTLSGHIVPGYSGGSYSSSLKNTRGRTYSNDQIDGVMNVGGGLKLAVSLGKRLSVETGLLYARMGQKTREVTGGARVATLSTFSQKTIPTPLGNIRTKTRSVAYRTAGATLLNSIGNTDESIEQMFGTLEIPFSVRYRLNNNKVRFFVSGGFSGNIIVSNKVYLETDNHREHLGSTEDIRDFNLSTDWGLGVEYPLSKKIRLLVEPGFKYYLQSLSENDEIRFKPYMFSLSTGIGIEF